MHSIAGTLLYSTANSLWAVCVQAVRGLCASLVQALVLTHSKNTATNSMGIKVLFMNRLYQFCTQQLPTAIMMFSPLLFDNVSTSSTGLIITTTKDI